MERHWTLEAVALLGILAGFVLAGRDATLLAGVVVAASAYALVLPDLAASPAGVGGATSAR